MLGFFHKILNKYWYIFDLSLIFIIGSKLPTAINDYIIIEQNSNLLPSS